jgi:hypothetical protein
MTEVKPGDLTEDERVAMIQLLQPAWDRIREPLRAPVVDLDLVRSRTRRRR